MKLAYKVSLPLAFLITALIWFVTFTSNETQREIISEGQIKTAQKITDQFEKNKEVILDFKMSEIEFLADMAVKISAGSLYDYDYEALKKPLREFMRNEGLKGIYVSEAIGNKEVVLIGSINPKYSVITKKVIWPETEETLGEVKVYYDFAHIKEYFADSKEQLLDNINLNNKEQNSYIEKVLQNQTYSNFVITIVLLIAIFVVIYRFVLNPLGLLKQGLDSFFLFLQNKSDEVETIQIDSSQEFAKMSNSLNENIAITAKLHKQINELNANLEKKVEERTQELHIKSNQIAQLLDNAAEGFLSYDETLVVNSEYSKECDNIFGKSIAGIKISDLLYEKKSDEKQLFEKVMHDLFDVNIKAKKKRVFINLLPGEFCINERSVKIEYKLIDEKTIMLIVEDITEKKQLEQKVEHEKRVLKMVVSVVSNVAEFKEILFEYKQFSKNRELYLQDRQQFVNNLVEFYRKIHTFKGNFAQKDLMYIVPKLHEFENSLNVLIKTPQRKFEEFEKLIQNHDIEKWIDEDIKILEDILDEKFLKANDAIEISKPVLENIESKIKQLLQFPKSQREVTYEEILADVTKIKKRPIKEYLLSYQKLVEQISKRLEKPTYTMQILGADDIYVNENFKDFAKSLVHIFRNSVDHGIETVDKRIALGKDEKATISCVVSQDATSIHLEIIDDGRGIDREVIAQKAIQKGLYFQEQLEKMSDDEIYLILFEDAFSTKEIATDLSGRGIGLGAVKAECEKLGGKIEVESILDKGTTFRFVLPLKS